MDVENLIKCVREYPALYDLSNRHYKNVVQKTLIWERIGKELNQNSDNVKQKWKTIRDGYYKYKKQLKKYKGTQKTVTDYVWSPQLRFLDNYIVNRKPLKKIKSASISIENEQPEELATFITNTASQEWKDLPITQSTGVTQYLNDRKDSNNDIDLLFLSYAETFKKFPPKLQLELKLELARLFSETELKLLESTDSCTVIKIENVS